MGNYILTYRIYPYNAWANTQDNEDNFRNTGLNLAAAINGIPGLSATYEELGTRERTSSGNSYTSYGKNHIVRVIKDVTSSSGKTVVNREVTSASLTIPTGLSNSLIQSTNFNDATYYYRPEASIHNNGGDPTNGNSRTNANMRARINTIDGYVDHLGGNAFSTCLLYTSPSPRDRG